MDIARVEGTSEFPVADMNFSVVADAQRTTVDLNDAPFKIKEEHLNRLRALSKTGNDSFLSIICLMFELSYSVYYSCNTVRLCVASKLLAGVIYTVSYKNICYTYFSSLLEIKICRCLNFHKY